MKLKFIASISVLLGFSFSGFSQVLHLQDALNRSVENFDRIKSKQALIQASEQNIAYQKKQLMPDFTLAAQQSFGTINAQNGPMYAYGGLGAASTSMPLAEQNWNAAFGSLYFANINWSIFAFGKLKQEINVAKSKEQIASADLEQEIFQHQIKVSANYLSLLASQRIKYVQEKNLDRAKVFHEITTTRANSGLIPEVDAALAKAEVSNAQSQQIKAYDKELEFSKNLAVLLGDKFQLFQLDSLFSTSVPLSIKAQTDEVTVKHPLLTWQQSKINQSTQAETLIRKYRMPTVSAFGVIQGRGSGFDWNYIQDNKSYSSSYTKGVGIDRSNYLIGLSLSWNLTNIFRQNSKVAEQQFITKSLLHEHQLLNEELNAQSALAKAKTKNAVENFEETKVQLSAAQQAYLQHKALYENGLTNLVDYTQSLYSLNRAEIDFEIAQNNVWQSLLLQAAAHGDLNILLNAIQK